MCKPQVFGLWAGLSLPFFEILGFEHVEVLHNFLRRNGSQVNKYLREPKLSGVFGSDMQASGFWALGWFS